MRVLAANLLALLRNVDLWAARNRQPPCRRGRCAARSGRVGSLHWRHPGSTGRATGCGHDAATRESPRTPPAAAHRVGRRQPPGGRGLVRPRRGPDRAHRSGCERLLGDRVRTALPRPRRRPRRHVRRPGVIGSAKRCSLPCRLRGPIRSAVRRHPHVGPRGRDLADRRRPARPSWQTRCARTAAPNDRSGPAGSTLAAGL